MTARILIVDDEPFNVDYLEQELEDLGYETVSACNGQEALDRVAEAPPDLVLLDVMMPILDGFAVCRRLKDDDETRLIPIVIMTALDAVDDRIKGIEAGADDFLTKPVDDRELVARIETSLKLKRTVENKLGELRQIKDHFSKFVPDTVKRLIAENPDAPELAKKERDVSVLFVDISGYTRLSERFPQDVVNAMVERYFSAFLECIHNAGGDISSTSGDGLMAIFESSEAGRAGFDDHPVAAAQTALELFKITAQLNEQNDLEPLTLHMGLNSGVALVGSTRFESSNSAHWTFTADGPVTNLAARLAGVAEGNQCVVAPETVRRLGDRYAFEPLGQKRLKNLAEPIELHCIVA